MKKQMILLGMLMAFCMTEAKVTLPALFTDNMILQQKSNVIFHGHSSTKKEVIITTGWSKHPYTTSPHLPEVLMKSSFRTGINTYCKIF